MSDRSDKIAAGPRALALALALLPALAPALLFAPAVLSRETLVSRDLFVLYHPLRAFLGERLAAGELPLWNPRTGCGVPFLADPVTQSTYPGLLPLVAWLPHGVAFDLSLGLHAVLAAVGMAAYARALGAGRAGGAVAGIVYAANGCAVSFHNHPPFAFSGAWLPVVLLATRRLLEQPGPRRYAALAAALALQTLAGGAELVLATVVLMAGEAALAAARARSGARAQAGAGAEGDAPEGGLPQGAGAGAATAPGAVRAAAAPLVRLGLAGSLALALAAVQVVPTLEYVREGSRAAGVDRAEAFIWSFRPAQLAEVAVPFAFGYYPTGRYWGARHADTAFGGAPLFMSSYLGPVALALAAAGLAAARPRRIALGLGAVALGAFVLALGRYTPIFPFVHDHVPGIALFRYPGKMLYLVAFALSALAGLGTAAWTGDDDDAARRAGRAAAAVAAALGLAAALAGATALRPSLAGCVHAALAAVALLALLAARRRFGFGPRAAGVAAAVLVAADLVVATRPVLVTLPEWLLEEPPAVVAELRAREPAPEGRVRVSLAPGVPSRAPPAESMPAGVSRLHGVRIAARERLEPILSCVWGLEDPNHYGSMRLGHVTALWRGLDERSDQDGVVRSRYDLAYALTNTGWLLSPRPDGPGDEVHALRYPDALPRAFLVGRATVVEDDAAAIVRLRSVDARGAAAFDPRAEAVLVAAPAASALDAPAGPAGEARVVRYAPEGIEVEVRAGREAYLVLLDAWFPGWEATVDGRPAPIARADVAFRAVRVPPGEHVVRLDYRPRSVTAGLAISAAALLALLGLVIRGTPGRA